MLGHLWGGVVELTCAGRTDAGVHARGQVAHADVDAMQWARIIDDKEPAGATRINKALPGDIRVLGVQRAPEGFDARFAAIWRRYSYRVSDDPTGPAPLTRAFTLPWFRRLDVQAMNAAAAGLLGEHDFAPFCKARPFASTVRCLQQLRWDRVDEVAVMTVQADAFCHSMVRSLVGVMLPVGDGRRPIDWPGTVLALGGKDSSVTTMPAYPLTLEAVGYPADNELQARQDRTRARRSLGEGASEGSPDGSGD